MNVRNNREASTAGARSLSDFVGRDVYLSEPEQLRRVVNVVPQ